MGFLAPLLLLASFSFWSHQEEPPVFGAGTIQISQNNWIEYRPKLTKRALWSEALTCANPCAGKKHLLHAECDASCDGACTESHKYLFECRWTCAPGGDIKA